MPLKHLLSSVFDATAPRVSTHKETAQSRTHQMEKAEIMALFERELSAEPDLHKSRAGKAGEMRG